MTTEAIIRCGNDIRSHAQVRDRAARLASALAGLGVGHGDRYALVMRNEVVVFEETLPREDTGKLFKRRLKAPYWDQRTSRSEPERT